MSAAPRPARIVCFGEVMLRLKAPDGERLMQSPGLEASFGGAEANVAVSLAGFGLDCAFVTAVPDTPIAEACLAQLRGFGVDVSQVRRQPGRLGAYFLEPGAGPRPPRVVYDREGSAMARAGPGDFDWQVILAGADILHLSGVTCAISSGGAALCLEAARAARRFGVTVVCDLNYRSKLWTAGASPLAVMSALVAEADIAIVNEAHARQCLGVSLASEHMALIGAARQAALCDAVIAAFPNLGSVATTTREGRGAGRSLWSAGLLRHGAFHASRVFEIDAVVDRVGAGDAFAAGVIYGLVRGLDARARLDFAAAASCLKNTILGDFNRVGVAEVEALARGEDSGRIER